MIPPDEIDMTLARLDELVPNLMARAEIQHLLAERKLFVAEHEALRTGGQETIERWPLAWQAVEAFT